MNPERFKSQREQLNPDQFLSVVEKVVQRRGIMVLANDVDLTLSTGGTLGEDDPRQTQIYPASGQALSRMEWEGNKIGIISNRAGGQVARMLVESSIRSATVVGTYGQELFTVNAKEPGFGTSFIDKRWLPYKNTITDSLHTIRTKLMDYLQQSDAAGDKVEVEIPTPGGPIIVERKGLNEEYPEGLAHTYNLNLVLPEVRDLIVDFLHERYTAQIIPEELKRVWGEVSEIMFPENPGRYSLSFEPLIKQGKAYGMVRLLRQLQTEMTPKQRIGLIVFAGDSNADAEAMRAAAMVANSTNRERRSLYPVHSVGIWVKPETEQPTVAQQATLQVDGVGEYAHLLQEMCEICRRGVW